jgi:hypothetical protein
MATPARTAPEAQWLLFLTNRQERFEPPKAPSASEGEPHGWGEGQEK